MNLLEGKVVAMTGAETMGNWPKAFYETSDEDWNLVIDTDLPALTGPGSGLVFGG
jgi:hypothetical protein